MPVIMSRTVCSAATDTTVAPTTNRIAMNEDAIVHQARRSAEWAPARERRKTTFAGPGG